MKSKLDIIDDVIEAKEPVPENVTVDAFIQFRAMDLYAKEVAIGFALHVVGQMTIPNNLTILTDEQIKLIKFPSQVQNIFNQFIQSLNKEG